MYRQYVVVLVRAGAGAGDGDGDGDGDWDGLDWSDSWDESRGG